jgi:hypothetical protein
MTSSFLPAIFGTFCVVTTLPRTLAMNMRGSFQSPQATGIRQQASGSTTLACVVLLPVACCLLPVV